MSYRIKNLKLNKWFSFLHIILISVISACLPLKTRSSVGDISQQFELRKFIQASDNVVIYNDNEKSFFRYKSSPALVKSFHQVIDVKKLNVGFDCLCNAEHVIIFYEGNTFKAAVALHESMDMRWAGGPWEGDASLKEIAYMQYKEWLEEIKEKLVKIPQNQYELPKVLQ